MIIISERIINGGLYISPELEYNFSYYASLSILWTLFVVISVFISLIIPQLLIPNVEEMNTGKKINNFLKKLVTITVIILLGFFILGVYFYRNGEFKKYSTTFATRISSHIIFQKGETPSLVLE